MEIKAKNIQIGYGDFVVVDEIDVSVYKGQITTIIGPNGSGKSTVLKALTRLLPLKKGEVYLNETNVDLINNKEFARVVGVLPQKHSAPPDFKVKDLVSYGRMPYQKWNKGNSEEDKEIVDWAMEMSGVKHLKDKSINACSGGEAQRVWIATVLAQKPELLFLDEPTTYLDISHQLETMKLVKNLNRVSNMGIIMVLHDLSHALEVSDRIIVIKNGKKYSEGTPNEVITKKMMKEVYDVDCEIINIENRDKPVIVYKEIN
ncbi:MAG: ABC transporter ATP-binding protein [Peptostreptococcaceae bacterium]